ncbi:MAG TPA: alpha/beta hydrolase, partial [Burkholderiaceae bacterium]
MKPILSRVTPLRHALRLLACTAGSLAPLAGQAADPVSLAQFIAIERAAPTLQLAYGAAPSQQIDVFIPAGQGPHPVAVLIHGGCWSAATAGREQLRHLGAELARDGIAVWSIGYRRANEAGGGYPGTYLDVADGIDTLRTHATRHGLDLARSVLVGHSAGGHLALWAAARGGLERGSALYRAAPYTPHTTIALAGIGDLAAFRPQIPVICGDGIAEPLLGPA